MKHLLVTLAICVASNSPNIEALPSNQFPQEGDQQPDSVANTPDFEKITIDHAREYVQAIYPFAAQVQQSHGIPVQLTLAIACLESGYGRSYNAQNKFNHLGIRVYNHGKAGYRTFSSSKDCFEYYAQLFDHPRYAPLQQLKDSDLKTWAEALQVCGFNQRLDYSQKVINMIRFIHLDQIEFA